MNDYNDYYNYMNSLNQGNMKNPKVNMDPKNFGYDTDPYKGFIDGNMFKNLYEGYKNYKPYEVNPSNEREYSLLLVQIYGFAAHDLGLYLDVYPNDAKAVKLRDEYVRLHNQALNQYENKYGAITLSSSMLNNVPWGWDDNNWPWEVIK